MKEERRTRDSAGFQSNESRALEAINQGARLHGHLSTCDKKQHK